MENDMLSRTLQPVVHVFNLDSDSFSSVMHKVFVIFLICSSKSALGLQIQRLPCFTAESTEDLNDARKELVTVDSYLAKTVGTLENDVQKSVNIMKNHLVKLKNNVGKIIKKVETDLSLDTGLKKVQWKKYQAHCYHFSPEMSPWFEAERLCRDFGGYLVKIDSSSENTWLHSTRKKGKGYWIGLTDLIEGEWRWSVDQSLASFKAWINGYGSKGHSYDCAAFVGGQAEWFDATCKNKYYYICEKNYCN